MKQISKKIRSPAAGMMARPPMARMLAIHDVLMRGKFPNCRSMAAELEVAAKTVQRDIDFMRDQLALPIAYHAVKHGFYYSSPVRQFPTVHVSDGELVALLIAQKAVEQYRGTAFEKPLHSAFTKLADGMQSSSGIKIHDLAEAISFRPQGLAESELDTFQTLATATLDHHEVQFHYRALHSDGVSERRIQPYHLGCLANQWYLIGHDLNRDARRTFALTRIKDAVDTGIAFEKPQNFSVEEMFASSFSAFQSGTVERVELRLDGFAARLATERSWHDSQQLVLNKDGTGTLTFELTLAPDFENWILQWGEHAEVIHPPELRKKIASTINAMQKIYLVTN